MLNSNWQSAIQASSRIITDLVSFSVFNGPFGAHILGLKANSPSMSQKTILIVDISQTKSCLLTGWYVLVKTLMRKLASATDPRQNQLYSVLSIIEFTLSLIQGKFPSIANWASGIQLESSQSASISAIEVDNMNRQMLWQALTVCCMKLDQLMAFRISQRLYIQLCKIIP